MFGGIIMAKDYLGTYNGSVFYPINADKLDDVNLESIAFALSTNSRFCGHTKKFWSVAQHSLLVSEIIEKSCNKEIAEAGLDINKASLIALLHDASEAYLSDMCRPIKKFMSDYAKYETLVQNKIYKVFGINQHDIDKYSKWIRFADDTALYTEAITLMNPSKIWLEDYADGFSNKTIYEYTDHIKIENMQIVEAKFICKCVKLCSKLGIKVDCIDKLPKYQCIDDEIPIISEGKVMCYAKFNDGIAQFRMNNIKLNIPEHVANNTIDLQYLFELSLGGSNNEN